MIAAQSIGEPGTQLTMRTFHIGGAASRAAVASSVDAKSEGTVGFNPTMRYVTNGKGELVVISRSGEIVITDPHGRERERHKVPYGALLGVKADQQVKAGTVLATWDPLTRPIITEFAGRAKFENVEEGVTVAKQLDEVTGLSTLVVIDPKRRGATKVVRPQVKLLDAAGNEVKIPGTDHSVTIGFPVGSLIQIRDGQDLTPGEVLARIPVEGQKTRDITGGLPRVAELFEARTPKDKGTLAEMTGTVSFGKETKGKVRLQITDPEGKVYEELVPKEKNIVVHEGQVVNKGESIVDGPADPQDILRLLGMEELARYIVDEVQDVYRLQGVKINDKHIEVIVRQMLRRVQITNPGDTELHPRRAGRALGAARPQRQGAGRRQAAGDLRRRPARHHQGVAVDRQLHLGGVVPGDDAGADRGGDHGQARRAARAEGERHRRPADPCRHRHGVPRGAQGQGSDGRRRAPRHRRPGSRGAGVGADGAGRRGDGCCGGGDRRHRVDASFGFDKGGPAGPPFFRSGVDGAAGCDRCERAGKRCSSAGRRGLQLRCRHRLLAQLPQRGSAVRRRARRDRSARGPRHAQRRTRSAPSGSAARVGAHALAGPLDARPSRRSRATHSIASSRSWRWLWLTQPSASCRSPSSRQATRAAGSVSASARTP